MSDVFRVPQSEAEKPENRFTFEIEDKKFDIPKLGFLQHKHLMILNRPLESDADVDEITYDLFSELTGEPDLVRALDRRQIDALRKAYREASDITEGESSASSSS